MKISKQDFVKINDYLWEVPKSFRSNMRVPARAYLSEKMLEQSFKDRSLEQLVNMASLPGIMKYSLAMPDMHEGYGFCIGGVAATDFEEGVISPGGVGYDINCLSPNTKVLIENGAYVTIKELSNFWKDKKIKFLDRVRKRIKETEILCFLKRYNNPSIYRIVTTSGNEIEATDDHPIQTKQGMKEVSRLKEGDYVLVYPFKGVKYERPNSRTILTKTNIEEVLAKIRKIHTGGHFSGQIIRELESRDLLPLKYNSSYIPVLLKLMGYIFGDGSISIGSKSQIWFYGKPEDLKEIQRDVARLGFTPSKVYSRKRNHYINTFYRTYQFSRTEYSVRVNSLSLAVLFISLGVPYGFKAHQSYRVPKWIFKCPLWQKRLFLAALFGAELSTPSTLNGYNFYAPQLNMQKSERLEKNAKLFLEDIAKLLKEFGIKTYPVKKVDGYQYQGKKGKTIGFRLQIVQRAPNLLKFFETVNYEYNLQKHKEACLAAAYLRQKERIKEMRRRARKEIRRLYKRKGDFKKLAPQIICKYNSEYVTSQFLYHSIFPEKSHGVVRRRGDPRISSNFSTFEDFKKKYSYGNQGLVWEKIEKIEKIPYRNFVYDLTINNSNHNFIANTFVVSNCGMRLLVSNYKEQEIRDYIENLAEEIQKEVPSGLGKGRKIKLDFASLNKILKRGARALVEAGYGEKEDIENCEARGALEFADPDAVSEKAKRRGRDQVGTLGSGNHFLEIQKVAEIFDQEIAQVFGLFKDQVVIMIHTGSRGLGHQIASDYIMTMVRAMDKYGIRLPDKELAACPINSSEGRQYFSAMACGANFAWANRQMIAYYVRKSWKKILGENAGHLRILYDVAHNIAKIEEHEINGQKRKLCVHRKGSTRAFPPLHPEIPEKYRKVGQPVLIPGSMGTASYVLVGTKNAEESFYSTCFTADTKLLTDKGFYTFAEIYERTKNGETFLVPSFNEKSYQVEWKPVERVMRRKAPVIEISISQRGDVTLNRLKVTQDHKFYTLSGTKIIKKKIIEIEKEKETLFLLDKLSAPHYQLVDPQLAYLVGAIITDGYIYTGPGKGRYPYRGRKILFIQKKEAQKLPFIEYVQDCFQNVFHVPLREYRERESKGYIRGKLVQGVATNFVCTQAPPVSTLALIKENLTQWVLGLSEEATFNFLAGVIDGDGTWHPSHKVIEIFNGCEKITGAIITACLKLGILPYVSKQRKNCYIIQISERLSEIGKYTKRVKVTPHLRKYGTKFFAVRQLFKEVPDVKWPFSAKARRNNLMSKEKLYKFLFGEKSEIERRFKIDRERYKKILGEIKKLIDSPLRMQRVKKIKHLSPQIVFNITVKDNHNYFVFSNLFTPILVANCHGSGRTMSRHQAIKTISGQKIVNLLNSKGIIVKCRSFKGIAEEAPQAYKDISDVVEVVSRAGLSKKVAKLVPLAVIKGE